ncbi:MAG TPA: hypothetical protein VF590_16615, partial [Isosphaeraceae bacterium]
CPVSEGPPPDLAHGREARDNNRRWTVFSKLGLARASDDETGFSEGGGAKAYTTAETLLREKLTLDAQYIGGYTVECSLKALILERTPDADKPDKLKRITSGASMHRPEVLLGELRTLGVSLPLDLAKRMRRFDWTTDLRYETGRRDTGETIALLSMAKAIYDWAQGQLP